MVLLRFIEDLKNKIMLKDFIRLIKIIHIFMKYRIDLILKENNFSSSLASFILFFSPYKLIRPKDEGGVRLASALEEAGPIFIKFGQLLSTRPDILPRNIAIGLKRLQDNLTPFNTEQAKELIEKSLGNSIENTFVSFVEKPIASASIAQVYEAVLHSKEEVAIKVVRPGIAKLINKDLSLMRKIIKFVEWSYPDSRRLNLYQLLEEYKFVINDELDMRIEASNIGQTARNFKGNNLLYIPKVYKEFTSKNILVMEKIKGIQISDIEELNKNKINLKLLAERGVEIFFKQVFVDNFFHADMHPGNIFVSPKEPQNPTYIAVDYAIVGSLSEDELFQIGKILIALFNRNFLEISEIMINSKWVDQETRVIDLERTIRSACNPIFEEQIENINFGELLMFLFQSSKKYNLILPSTLMLLQKTLINVEGLGKQLYPKLDFWNIAKAFLKEWLAERYNPLKIQEWFKDNMFELIEQSKKVPHLAEKAITQIGMLENYSLQSEYQNKELIQEIKKGNQTQILIFLVIAGIVFWSVFNI